MEKQHIYLAFFTIVFQYMLVANESEAITKFHKETGDSFYKAVFKFKLQNGTCYSQETKIVAAVKHFIGILRLFGRKSAVEIVVYFWLSFNPFSNSSIVGIDDLKSFGKSLES